jgi:glycine/D-amino acid oxidase-like deaminating enzyme/nitrite reductase/ring-hydroxylating ferredoxin subunit
MGTCGNGRRFMGIDHYREFTRGKTTPLWIDTADEAEHPALPCTMSFDVAVVGGGIAGLTAAVLLKHSGAKVAVLEAGRIARGVTAHSTAKITSGHDVIYQDLINRFSEEKARQYAEANQGAVEFIAAFADERGVSCDFRRSFACTYTCEDQNLERIQKEVEIAGDLRLPVTYTESLPLPFPVKGAICYENQAYFHPRKYLLSMAEIIPGGGSRIFENTRVGDVEEGRPCRVITERGVVKADQVIVATHFPILNRGLFFAKMTPFRSYLTAMSLEQEAPEGMYISLDAPFHTIRKHRTDNGEDYLLLGGEDHEVGHEGNTAERYRRIETFARDHFRIRDILYRWSTQDNSPVDQVPFIGRHSLLSRRIYVATGFQGWGMTNGTVAGVLLSDMIAGRKNPWSGVFDPNRFTPFISRKFFSQNIHIAEMFVTDRVTGRAEKSLSDLEPGEGGIVEQNGKEFAASRDEEGTTRVLSPSCTHMGCKVTWNNAEESWDCPCHGSRFDRDGKVIQAPAVKDLIAEESKQRAVSSKK